MKQNIRKRKSKFKNKDTKEVKDFNEAQEIRENHIEDELKKLTLAVDSDDNATQDGYIGKIHPRARSEDMSEAESDGIDEILLNDAKLSVVVNFNTKMNYEKHLLQKSIDDAMHRMSLHVEKLVENANLSGAQLLGITKENKKKPIFSEKVYENKDSLLTESSKRGKEAHTVFNIFVAILILVFLKIFLHDRYTKGHSFMDVSLLYEIYTDIYNFWPYWTMNFLYSFVVVFFVKLIVAFKLPNVVYLPIYAVIIILNYVCPMYVSLALTDSLFVGMILTCEMARFSMKMHAYFREKLLHCTPNQYKTFVPNFAKKKGVTFEDLNMPDINMGSLFTEIKRFNYFLWCPRLVYRDEYPMRHRISKSHLLTNIITFNLCFYYTFALFKGFVIPTFHNYLKGIASIEDIITISVGTGIMFMTMAFFGLLHSWMNIFAEITRFGDREFYTDWWNVSNYGAYYRKWNIIVHEFLYYYIYNDSVRFSLGKISSTTSKFLVFSISAIVHEFIILSACKFFLPVLLILFGGPGVMFMSLTKSNNRILGIGLWFSLILGNGVLIMMYGLEYIIRQQPEYQAKIKEDGIISFFVPQLQHFYK